VRTPLDRNELTGRAFHNLRATQHTELAAEHLLHVVCGWIGNSKPVAARHYLRVTDTDFEKATGALQKALQEPTAPGCTDSQRDSVDPLPGQELLGLRQQVD